MSRARLVALILLLAALCPHGAWAQGWGTVEGRVTQAATEAPLPGATVLVAGTNYGTAADGEGRYALRVPEGRYALRVSAVGFAARTDSITVRRDRSVRWDVALEETTLALEGVTVRERAAPPVEAGVYTLDPEHVQNIPAPFHGGFRALKVLPGVATNNELSSQYSVRGGGYNENLIFINGFEVYMPFRPRQGEQEGLGLLNPDLARNITLYTGGFPARYGGKLSSALEVEYKQPQDQPLHGAVDLSLLDASASTSASALDGRLGGSLGVRKAQAERFFGTQELKGDYQPDFFDIQGTAAFRIAPGHVLEALGLWVDHEFRLDPSSKRTYYGILSQNPEIPSDLKSVYTDYEGAERDGYATRFGGLRLTNRLTERLTAAHDLALFQTEETERYRISGQSVLSRVDPGSGQETPIGYGEQEDRADNRVAVRTLTGRGRYGLTLRRHAFEAGWHVRRLRFEDRLSEELARIRFRPDGTRERLILGAARDSATVTTAQAGLYVQDAIDALPASDRLLLTGGLRADYYALNGQWTLSPRLSARYQLTEATTLTGAAGVYYQHPTYRELRGRPEAETDALALNRDLRAQRSVQFVLGGEHFLPEKRLYLRAEAFYKHLTHLISYDVENVRVLYSGHNDARGFTYGLDVQLRGEFVPGLESWFNYSFLVSRARFREAFQTEYNQGLVPRPADQRHTFSAYVQDYVPGDRSWKLHLRLLFGSGLPYTPPVRGAEVAGGVYYQIPGPRNAQRFNEYRRIDVGATKTVTVFERGSGDAPVELSLTAEVLNIFDMTNTVAYTWDGAFNRIPTRLTPRTINARLRITF